LHLIAPMKNLFVNNFAFLGSFGNAPIAAKTGRE